MTKQIFGMEQVPTLYYFIYSDMICTSDCRTCLDQTTCTTCKEKYYEYDGGCNSKYNNNYKYKNNLMKWNEYVILTYWGEGSNA